VLADPGFGIRGRDVVSIIGPSRRGNTTIVNVKTFVDKAVAMK